MGYMNFYTPHDLSLLLITFIVPFFFIPYYYLFNSANQCIHDVLALANLLVQLKSNTVPDIEELFESYFKARSPVGRTVVNMSSRVGNLMNRKVDQATKKIFSHE